VLLGLSAGIGRMTLFIEASLIDNAKGAPVVAFDMNVTVHFSARFPEK
jgi:hypothetical protein